MAASVRQTGMVKFFNSQKGYGFIIPFDTHMINPAGRSESTAISEAARQRAVRNFYTFRFYVLPLS
jgi:hypothetical protein